MSYMVANETVAQWVTALQTTVYNGAFTMADPNTELYLAMTLNTLTMVEGGGDVVNHQPTIDSGFDQGCYVSTTWVSPFIFVLAGLAALALIWMVAYYFILLLRLGIGRGVFSKGNERSASLNSLPESLIGVSTITPFWY